MHATAVARIRLSSLGPEIVARVIVRAHRPGTAPVVALRLVSARFNTVCAVCSSVGAAR